MAWVSDVVESRGTVDTLMKQQQALPSSSAFSRLPDNHVLRVFQFDALVTQQEVVDILRSSLFHIFDIGSLQSWRFAHQEELVLILDLVLYRYSTWRLGQSVGDRLQNLVMRDEQRAVELGLQSSTSLVPTLAPTRRLLLVHALLTILVPYAVRKFQRKTLDEGWEREDSSDWRCRAARSFRYLFVAWSALSLLNTMHFLATGQYRTLVERLLSLKMVYGSQKMMRFTNLLYLNQHVMWTTWASLLSVLNVGRYVSRFVHSVQSIASPAGSLTGNENVCCACRETPTISQRSNCGHLYCYYCIKSRLLDSQAAGSFRCLRCGQSVHDCSPA